MEENPKSKILSLIDHYFTENEMLHSRTSMRYEATGLYTASTPSLGLSEILADYENLTKENHGLKTAIKGIYEFAKPMVEVPPPAPSFAGGSGVYSKNDFKKLSNQRPCMSENDKQKATKKRQAIVLANKSRKKATVEPQVSNDSTMSSGRKPLDSVDWPPYLADHGATPSSKTI